MILQRPHYGFLKFKQGNHGKFDIPIESYEQLVARKRSENEREMEQELTRGNISDETAIKINNRLEDWGLSGEYTLHDVVSSYKQFTACTDRPSTLVHKMLANMFAKSPSRQNLGEVHCENLLKYVSGQINIFSWEKLSGKRSLWVDNGKVVNQKPQNSVEIKSLDYSITLDDVQIYSAQKRMKISDGGHQNNQASELYRFAKETKLADGYMPVAILDGAITAASTAQITGLNDKIVLLQSDDFLYFAKWLQHEKLTAQIQQEQVAA